MSIKSKNLVDYRIKLYTSHVNYYLFYAEKNT